MSKIYTKTGDKGMTSLFNGTRVLKADIRVRAYGSIDELNTVIGLVLSFGQNEKIDKKIINLLVKIQNDLFNIGAMLANPKSNSDDSFLKILPVKILEFENSIDEMTNKMPELKNFILPGGIITGAFLQFSRAVCRRAEREITVLDKEEKVQNAIIIYINRLSDLLFTMSRFVNFKQSIKEKIWHK